MSEAFNQRFRRMAGALKAPDIARPTGLSENSIRGYFTDSEPKLSNLLKLAEFFNCTVQYLATGEGEPSGGVEKATQVQILDLRLGPADADRVDRIVFLDTDWLNQEMGTLNVFCCIVGDRAMEPALQAGSTAFLARTKVYSRPGIYLIQQQGQGLQLRHLQAGLDTTEVAAYSQEYQNLTLANAEFVRDYQIRGRVQLALQRF